MTRPSGDALAAEVREPFRDVARHADCVLVITPAGKVHAGPGEPKIGVEHPGCTRLADLILELDAFFCPLCQRTGRVSGSWAADRIRAARG